MIDEWSGLATLLAELITKYISEMNLDELPDPPRIRMQETKTHCVEDVENNNCTIDKDQVA